MDVRWLKKNVERAYRSSPSLREMANQLRWMYAGKPHSRLQAEEYELVFRYEDPIGDVNLVLRANDGADGFIHGEVFNHQYYYNPQLTSPETILDLGANIGLTAVYFGRLYPQAQIACVEPMPNNLELLRKNIELNGTKAEIFPAAVDVTDGTVVMETDYKDYGFKVGQVGISVAAVSVPTIMTRMGWSRVDFVKMDIEGHEATVLKQNAEWLHHVGCLAAEIHDDELVGELPMIAQAFGFERPVELHGNWWFHRPAHRKV